MILTALLLLCQVAKPSVLVIVGDDVAWTERGSMPALDEIAARGATFTRAYAFPVCSPTRYATLFGQFPRRQGIGDTISAHNSASDPSPAPDRQPVSLAEALKPSHATALFGKWHLGRASVGGRVDLLDSTESGPFVAGFDAWRAGSPNSIALGPGASGYYDWYRVDDELVTLNTTSYATHAQRDEFISWWSSTSGPKFAWLAFNSAHAPYDLPPGHAPTGSARGDYLELVSDLGQSIAACLAVVDWSNTIVLYLGDNGTPDEVRPVGTPAGYWKGTCFEGGVRVPLIVAAPGGSAGVSSSRLVSCVDIGATLLELLGTSSRGFEDSRSFADELGPWAGAPPRSFVFSERFSKPVVGLSSNPDEQVVIESRWKLRRFDPDGPGGLRRPVDTAYYLPNDPYEQQPIDPATLPSSIRTRLVAQLASLPARQ